MIERYQYADAEKSAIYADFGDGRTATIPAGSRMFADLVFGNSEIRPKIIEPYEADAIDLIAYSASVRWAKETGGIVLSNGMSVPTDPVAQTKIAATKTAFDNGTLTRAIDFKGDSGWVSTDAPTFTIVYRAVVAHIENLYKIERDVSEKIANGTITTTKQIDAAFGG